jgi:sugar lactone lactonase YvrE
MVWPAPPDAPRIRLERVVATDRDTGRDQGFLDALAGREAAPLFERPYGVAWNGGDLVVTDPGAGRLVVIAADGGVRRTPAGLLDRPVGIAVCRGGFVVSEPALGRVSAVSADLSSRDSIAEGLARPTGVACSGSDVFVLETGAHSIRFFRDDGRTGTWGRRGEGSGEFNFPAALAVSGDLLFVGDTLNFRIQRVNAASGAGAGSFGRLGDAAGEMPRIKGIGVDTRGVVWVTDALLDQVALYEGSGAYLMSVGGAGTGPGSFSFPAGVAGHSDGRVAVVDSLGRRVQVFRVLGTGGADER